MDNIYEILLTELAEIKRNTLLAARNVLTFEDVVLLTGLSKSHLYNLTHRKEIPYYRPRGKQIYFDRAEVEAWMKQNRVNTRGDVDLIIDHLTQTANSLKVFNHGNHRNN